MRSFKARKERSSRIRWGRSRDANEPAIIAAVRGAGWHVAKLDGTGLPDLLCLAPDGRRAVLLEVKVAGGERLASGRKRQPGRLTPAQEAVHAALARAGWTVHVVRTPDEARAALGAPLRGLRHLDELSALARSPAMPSPVSAWESEREGQRGEENDGPVDGGHSLRTLLEGLRQPTPAVVRNRKAGAP